MSTIQEDIRLIRQAIYGRDVREAIADGLEHCYDDNESVISKAQRISDSANAAAENAEAKAGLANTSAENADRKASLAQAAATMIQDMTVAADTLPPGSTSTVDISEVNGHKHIQFGLVKGDKGADFVIAKTFASIAEMNAYTGTDVKAGQFVMITSNVDDPDNAKMFVKTTSGFNFVTDLSGAQGIKGETGNGIASVALNPNYTLTITFTDGTTKTTTSIRGEKGEQGIQGIQGLQGEQGKKGDKGDRGDPFTISKTFSSVAEMEAYSGPDVITGSFLLVTDSDGSSVYIKTDNGHSFVSTVKVGPKGDKGDALFNIKKTFSSVAEMNAYTGTDVVNGDFVLVKASLTQDPITFSQLDVSNNEEVVNFDFTPGSAIGLDSALYQKTASGYEFITYISIGPQGPKGDAGDPTLLINDAVEESSTETWSINKIKEYIQSVLANAR